MTSLPSIITIDGPAASGKSTLGKSLADALGYLFFDTGVMYRAVTWSALERGVPVDAESQITALAEALHIDVRPASVTDGRSYDVWVDGRDITWEIRRPEVDANVSVVSAFPGVRRALSLLQRRIGMRGRVVMVGRDIGTVVLPEAGLKIYLEASVAERARRRYEEQRARGDPADYHSIYKAMQARDRIDASRDVAPMRPAQDAILLDSEGMDADRVLQRVLAMFAGEGDGNRRQP